MAQPSHRLAGFALSHLLSLLQRELFPRCSSWSNCSPLHTCNEQSLAQTLNSVRWSGPCLAIMPDPCPPIYQPVSFPSLNLLVSGHLLLLSSAWKVLHVVLSSRRASYISSHSGREHCGSITVVTQGPSGSTALGSRRGASLFSHTGMVGCYSVLALPCASDDTMIREDKLLAP